ncbi:hypothetical protein POSPLADRAFT_1060672 [Postia placenta MAD-698-R-SB12]|uniref:Uncharacterized protein n=1 Tax=Postia placenta MAD-698-R-SB12 TaxID=670580 RepID=A0A1X6MP24_9APHY|nr:hypothetical protein POSPLADRAFT_1060672 [Postia placenta MAD-698-R-SB12]OSX58171.1 hypothetical protein POSPLADRAFT_1060672 [Postia placenta MAD-698-R-SB12]
MKFINKRFVVENKVQMRRLKEPIPLYNIDGTLNKDGSISEVAVLQMHIGEHVDRRQALLGPDSPLFGTRIPPGTSTQSPNTSISPSTLFDTFDDLGTSSTFGEQ